MRNSVRKFQGFLIGAVLALLASSSAVHATTGCFEWQGNFAGTGVPANPSGAAMCAAIAAKSSSNGITYNVTNASPETATSGTSVLTCSGTITDTVGGCGACTWGPDSVPAQSYTCPVTCAIGLTADAMGAGTANVSALGGGSYCNNGCEYKAVPTTLILSDGAHYAIGGAQTTGNACGTGAAPVTTGANCWQSHGETICIDSDHNGATIQGDAIAMASVPGGGNCIGYESGGTLCTMPAGATSQPTPPAPDNGTPGTPATPTATVSKGGTTANYYSGATSANSSNPVVTQGNANGTPAGQSTQQEQAASAAQPDDCGDGSACTGTVPTLPDQQDVATTTSSYTGSLGSVPIVAAVQNISASIPPGVCPTASFTVFGSTYTIDEQCTLWESVSSIVQACMMAVWLFMGIRILMSA
jgi:hypothetical protein